MSSTVSRYCWTCLNVTNMELRIGLNGKATYKCQICGRGGLAVDVVRF